MAAFQPPTVLTGNSDGPASAFGDALTAQTDAGSSDVPKRVIGTMSASRPSYP